MHRLQCRRLTNLVVFFINTVQCVFYELCEICNCEAQQVYSAAVFLLHQSKNECIMKNAEGWGRPFCFFNVCAYFTNFVIHVTVKHKQRLCSAAVFLLHQSLYLCGSHPPTPRSDFFCDNNTNTIVDANTLVLYFKILYFRIIQKGRLALNCCCIAR